MGFLEELRRQKVAEEQVQQIARQNTGKERLASLESAKKQEVQKEKEAEDARNLIKKSKIKFHRAGIPELIKSLNEIKPIRFEEGYPHDEYALTPDRNERYGFDQDWKYHCRVYLTKRHDSGGGDMYYEEVYFSIITDSEGTISFEGAKKKKIKQSKWEKNPEILEEALGNAYHSPAILQGKYMPSSGKWWQ